MCLPLFGLRNDYEINSLPTRRIYLVRRKSPRTFYVMVSLPQFAPSFMACHAISALQSPTLSPTPLLDSSS